jgi:hypothetical protein
LLTLNGWGHVVKTNDEGRVADPAHGFSDELAAGVRPLHLWHPAYDSLILRNYGPDSRGVVTVSMRKGGTASLMVKVALDVRRKPVDASCRVRLLSADDRTEVRRMNKERDRTYRFSGLKPGKYAIEAYFWDSYPTHLEPVTLSASETTTVQIRARTDQLARIPVAGRIISTLTGQGIEGLTVHFVGAPGDNATTTDSGKFSTVADRARFHQCLVMRGRKVLRAVRIRNSITESQARSLVIHIDPEAKRGDPPLGDDDGDGVYCSASECKACDATSRQGHTKTDQ